MGGTILAGLDSISVRSIEKLNILIIRVICFWGESFPKVSYLILKTKSLADSTRLLSLAFEKMYSIEEFQLLRVQTKRIHVETLICNA